MCKAKQQRRARDLPILVRRRDQLGHGPAVTGHGVAAPFPHAPEEARKGPIRFGGRDGLVQRYCGSY